MGDDTVTVVGTQKSRSLGDVCGSVAVETTRGSVEFTASGDVDLVISGDRNSVAAAGTDATVRLTIEGDRNSVSVARALDLDIVADEGRANSIDRHGEDSTETDLIRQDRDEAYADLGLFDYTVVSYQTRATEREFCHNCGRDAETIVRRHDEKVLRIFGLTVSTSERTATDECPNCTPYVTDDEVELTESERRDIFG
jgi:ribosomal protein L34E